MMADRVAYPVNIVETEAPRTAFSTRRREEKDLLRA